MLVSAQRVVGERADHIAIADRVVAMASDDALELMLQPSELGDLFPHGGKMLGGDAVRLAAGAFRMLAQCQKVPDRLYRKSEVACVADESERFELTLFIAALIALRALRCREQTHLLVIADGRDFYAVRRERSPIVYMRPISPTLKLRTSGRKTVTALFEYSSL